MTNPFDEGVPILMVKLARVEKGGEDMRLEYFLSNLASVLADGFMENLADSLETYAQRLREGLGNSNEQMN